MWITAEPASTVNGYFPWHLGEWDVSTLCKNCISIVLHWMPWQSCAFLFPLHCLSRDWNLITIRLEQQNHGPSYSSAPKNISTMLLNSICFAYNGKNWSNFFASWNSVVHTWHASCLVELKTCLSFQGECTSWGRNMNLCGTEKDLACCFCDKLPGGLIHCFKEANSSASLELNHLGHLT